MSRTYTAITGEMADYIASVTSREPEVLQRLRKATENHPRATLCSSPEQGQFLQLMAILLRAKKTIEVGVFVGYSSTWVALALPPEGRMVACERNEEWAAVGRRTWREAGVENRIDLRMGPALDTLDALIAGGEAGTFDLVFIDADKTNYENYYERALVLLRPGGLVAADNVLWHGAVIDPAMRDADTEAIRAFNRKLHQDKRVALSLATLGDGLALACKL